MTTIVTRAGKGSPLTNTEVDTNFTNLNSAKLEAAVTSVAALTIGSTGTDLSSTVANGTTTPVISLQVPTASATNRGALSAADWSTFNGKQAALVSGTSIKTVNGTTLLGSGDVGVGVTSVTGTAPVVSSGGATPAISMAAANTTTNGYLTSTDWNTFNGKQAALVSGTNIKTVNGTTLLGSGDLSIAAGVTSVSGTAPVVSSGGATPAISMAAATTSVSGYLTSTDWNTFNGKQPAGSYITSGGALGTPSSGTLTNCTFPTLNQNTTGSSGSFTGNAATATTATTANALNSANSYTAVSFIASSDESLKINWVGLDLDFVARLSEVKHGTYERISSGNREVGVSAQSLQKVIPTAVIKGEDGLLAVNYGAAALVAAVELAKVVQELRAEIAELKAKLG